MAHMGEAQSIIELFNLEKKSPFLFHGEDLLLLITGEGPFEAATKTALILGEYSVTQITNLGVAGSLTNDYPVDSIHPVRTSYLAIDLKPNFKTFQLGSEGIDCITSFERILDQDKAQKLRGIGHLVDRELWGVATSAKTAGVPLRAFKIISDMAGTMEACEVVKDQAEGLSYKLAVFFKNSLCEVESETPEETTLPGFHFTFTMKHRYETLLKKLSLKEDKSEKEIQSSLHKEENYPETKPKERARLLISHMEDLLDPTKKILEAKKTAWLKDFTKSGIKVLTDPTWEEDKITLSFEASSDEELKAKALALQELSLASFHRLLNGELDVE